MLIKQSFLLPHHDVFVFFVLSLFDESLFDKYVWCGSHSCINNKTMEKLFDYLMLQTLFDWCNVSFLCWSCSQNLHYLF